MFETKATPGLPLKQVVRDAVGTLMEKFNGVAILGVNRDATAIRNKDSLSTDWQNSLNQYAAIQRSNATIRHVCDGGGMFKLITFTFKICCPKGMNAAE